jgi:hypothetical protein
VLGGGGGWGVRAGRSGDRIPVGAKFFEHVQTGSAAHPASCTMGTGSFMEPEVSLPYSQCSPPVPILSQLHPVPTTPSNFLKTHLNIILPSTSGFPQWPLSLRFPHQHPVHSSLLRHTRHMPRPSHSSRFTTRTIMGKEYRSFNSSLCNCWRQLYRNINVCYI